MTPTTRPLDESFRLTRTSDATARASQSAPSISMRTATIVQFLAPGPAEAIVPNGYRTISEIVSRMERNPAVRKELPDARRWVADAMLGGKPVTMRTLRLRKGMSQAQLAEAIGTQQPHVARIESGQADLRLETFRRIAEVLGVDLNTLNQALQGAVGKGP